MGAPEIMAAEEYFTPPDTDEQTAEPVIEQVAESKKPVEIFNCIKERDEIATEEYFFCHGHLTTVPVAERSTHDMNYCKQCWRVVSASTRAANKQPTVEELNAKFTGDLPSKWQEKQQEEQQVKKATKKMSVKRK